MILFVQTFGDLVTFNPHVHVRAADGVFREDGTFFVLPPVPRGLLERRFRTEVLAQLLRDQQQRLSRMLQGHYAYYGISSNIERLQALHRAAQRLWRKWLSRRSRRSNISWEKFLRLLARFPLPPPRIIHRYT